MNYTILKIFILILYSIHSIQTISISLCEGLDLFTEHLFKENKSLGLIVFVGVFISLSYLSFFFATDTASALDSTTFPLTEEGMSPANSIETTTEILKKKTDYDAKPDFEVLERNPHLAVLYYTAQK